MSRPQIGIGEAVQLLAYAYPSLTEVLAPGLELLREPVATLGAGERALEVRGIAY